jgi:AcrR family transcriptional regulator
MPDVTTPTTGDARRRRLTRPERQAQTRREILDAAAAEFAQRGFRVASLADIADRAGYTIGAVYSNFASKDALFHALMADRLRRVEEDLSRNADAVAGDGGTVEERIARELDRLQAAEDAVPAGWWRLLNEYRAVAAADPGTWEDLATVERRCREIIARQIATFAESVHIELPMTPVELAELTSALTDGLRAAHAEGRSSMSSGQGLRQVVAVMIEAARCGDVPGRPPQGGRVSGRAGGRVSG